MMRNLQAHTGFFRHMESFLHRFDHVVAFVAHMGGVITAIGPDGIDHLHQLFGGGITAGGIDQAGADAVGTILHGLCRQITHLPDLLLGGLLPGIAHDRLAQGAVTHQGCRIDAGPCLLHRCQIIGHGGILFGGSHRTAAIAAHIGGHAL